jgi:hypothetical protein
VPAGVVSRTSAVAVAAEVEAAEEDAATFPARPGGGGGEGEGAAGEGERPWRGAIGGAGTAGLPAAWAAAAAWRSARSAIESLSEACTSVWVVPK